MRINDEKLEVRSCKMHACVRHSLQIFRWSGVFPVTGLNDDFMTGSRYHVTLLHGTFIMMILLGQTLMSIAVLYKFVSAPVTLEGLGSVVFFLTGTVSSFKLLKLARNWPKLMKSAFKTERAISDLKTSQNIPILCKTALFSVATLGIVEHFLRKTYDIKAAMFSLGSNASHLEIYFEFQKASLPHVLYIIHNQWLAMFFEIILIHSTVLWNIIDALIMCACIYMASCLQDLNATIYSVKSNDATNWRLLREQYSKLIELLNKINKQLGGFVFLSLFENLFEICLQLFNSINHGKDVKFDFDDVGMQSGGLRLLHFIYFNFSTVYMMGKTFTLLLLAARVSYFAKEPLLALSYVPDSKYGIEIQRFSRQIRYTSNAISGVHFGIKKEAVVKVLASIITYELMMLQLRNE